MKMTLEISEELFRRSRASAALRDESLNDFVVGALRERVEREGAGIPVEFGWRKVFGKARPQDVAAIDAVVEEDLERVELDEWL